MKKTNLRIQQLASALLFLAVIGLAGYLSTQFKAEFDWTANQRNSLTAASLKQLANMKDPVKLIAFTPTGAESRAEILQFFNRYKLAKKDFTVEFIDPAKNPSKVREFNISAAGDMVIEYQGRHETVRGSEMNEAPVTQALQRLAYAEERWLVFLQGHGEHDLAGRGASSYAGFAQLLKTNGLKTQSLNLATIPRVPDNAAALVVAGPAAALTEGETAILVDYVAKGGNLLWLSDPDTPPPPAALQKALGVTLPAGTAIFPEFVAMGGDPGVFITAEYPRTPVTAELAENTAFPLMRAVATDPTAKPEPAFNAQPFLQSSQAAWLETGELSGEVELNAEQGDTAGPLTLGLLLTRSVKTAAPADAAADAKAAGKPQRIALVGDSDFLSDSGLGALGNAKLGLNLVRWLAARDEQLDILVPPAPDQSLDLSPPVALMIELGFLLLVPLALLGFGIGRWLVRRRR